MNLREQLDGARMVKADNERELTLAWFGGHGIHAYRDDGTEVSFWNVGNFQNNDADESVVAMSMQEAIEEGDYP